MRKQQHDQAIDNTLSALRTVEPSADLERRLLSTLERHTRQPAQALKPAWQTLLRNAADWQQLTGWRASHAALLAASVVLLALAAAIVAHHPNRARNTIAVTPVQPSPAIQPAPEPVTVAEAIPHPMPLKSSPRHASSHSTPASAALRVQPLSAPEPLPAPLTEQEKLLVQIARSHNPSEIAFLNPELLARQEAENDAEFRDFFASSSARKP